MNNAAPKQSTPAYELKNELARLCLPAASHDPQRNLAWVNSICLLFLIIGLAGARRGLIALKPVPSNEEIIPVMVEPMTFPPPATAEQKQNPDVEKNDAPRVAVALPQTPNLRFSVPAIGPLVLPARLASAPPLAPLRTTLPMGAVNSTGAGGDRPQPPYPKIALDEGAQGTVRLTLGVDAAGKVVSVEVNEPSGFPILDRSSAEFIKRHWRLPSGADSRLFETQIIYKLQLN